jgi:hypothetical protein
VLVANTAHQAKFDKGLKNLGSSGTSNRVARLQADAPPCGGVIVPVLLGLFCYRESSVIQMLQRVSFPALILGWLTVIAICIVAALINPAAHAQAPRGALPSTSQSLFHDDMPPGVIGSIQLRHKPHLRGVWQAIEVRGPQGVQVNFAEGGQFAPDIPSPARVAVLVGPVYRLRLTGIPGDEDLELFPTIEVIDRTCPPAEREHRFPIPIEIDEMDIADAARGEMVMRVIYVEDNEIAEPVNTAGLPQRVLDVRPDQNALRTADSMGRPVAILRMGSRVPNVTEGQDWLEFLYGCPPWTHLKAIPTKQQLIDEGRWPVTANSGSLSDRR